MMLPLSRPYSTSFILTSSLGLLCLGIFLPVILQLFFIEPAAADSVDIYAPRTDDRASIELEPGEKAELTIYLKSFGDPMENHKVFILDDLNRQVGLTNSDTSGIVTFSNLPAGRFRVFVERKKNIRGGASTVSVGDLRLKKLEATEPANEVQ